MATPVSEQKPAYQFSETDVSQAESCDIKKVWRLMSKLPHAETSKAIHERITREIASYDICHVETAIRILIEKKWIVEKVNRDKETVYKSDLYIDFCQSCEVCDYESVKCYLDIKGNAEINKVTELPYKPDGFWSCPLAEALGASVDDVKKKSVVDVLKKNGARIPPLIFNGETFLHIQARFVKDSLSASSDTEAIRYFMNNEDAKGAFLSKKNSAGRTPEEEAVFYGNKNIKSCLNERYQMIYRMRLLMANRIIDFVQEESEPASLLKIKGRFPRSKNIEDVFHYMLSESWLISDAAATRKYGNARYKINSYLKLLMACRDVNVEFIKAFAKEDKQFWHYSMRLPESGEVSTPLQEVLQSTSPSRDEGIKILAEAGAMFSITENVKEMHVFLLKQVDNENIKAFKDCLFYFDRDGEVLKHRAEGEKTLLQSILDQFGEGPFTEALNEHQLRVSPSEKGLYFPPLLDTASFVADEEGASNIDRERADSDSAEEYDLEAGKKISLKQQQGRGVESVEKGSSDKVDALLDLAESIDDSSNKLGVEVSQKEEGAELAVESASTLQLPLADTEEFFSQSFEESKGDEQVSRSRRKKNQRQRKKEKINKGLECLRRVDIQGFKDCFERLHMRTLFVDMNLNTPIHYVVDEIFLSSLERQPNIRWFNSFARCAEENVVIKDVVRFCVDKGCPVFAQNRRGETALHIAIRNANIELAGFLIRSFDNTEWLNLRDEHADTPLMLAVKMRLEEVVVQLLLREVAHDEVSCLSNLSIQYFNRLIACNKGLSSISVLPERTAISDKEKVD